MAAAVPPAGSCGRSPPQGVRCVPGNMRAWIPGEGGVRAGVIHEGLDAWGRRGTCGMRE